MKNNREAIRRCESALAESPDSAVLSYNLGLELSAAGDLRRAVEMFRQACRLDEHDADALSEIGGIEIAENHLNAARQSLDEALKRDPAHPAALNNRGVVEFIKGNYEEAARYFRAAVESNPELTDAWYNLADTCAELGDDRGKKQARLRYHELSDDN